jgi:hypothetical protein
MALDIVLRAPTSGSGDFKILLATTTTKTTFVTWIWSEETYPKKG